MTRTVAFFICFILFNTLLLAQKKEISRPVDTIYKWGVVPEADLKMTSYAPDTSAEAVVLFDVGYISTNYTFGLFSSSFTRHRRVKIFKKSAFSSEGDISIRHGGNLSRIEAQIIQEDGIIKKVDSTGIYDVKKSDGRFVKKFAFPDIKEGCIIEYKYTSVDDENILTLRDWYFQENIPVRRSELFFKIDNMLTYTYYFQGSNQKEDRLKDAVIPITAYELLDSTYPRLYRDTVPAMRQEGYITTMDDYLNRVRFQLSEIKSYRGTSQKILTTWEDISKALLAHQYLGVQYQKKGQYGNVWKTIKKELYDTMSTESKVRYIYEYISKNIDWIDDNFSIFSSKGLNDAFKSKKANSGELNLMLIACLNKIGLKAFPMLISTRDNGAPVDKYPIATQFNHILCYTELNGKPLMLDAGNIYRPMNIQRIPSLNEKGWVLEKNKSRWVNIQPSLSSNITAASFTLSDNGSLVGNMASLHQGYSAVNERMEAKDDDKLEKLKKKLVKDFSEIVVDSIVQQNLDKVSEPYKRKIYCTIPNAAIIGDGLIYIKPTLKTDFDESPFKSVKRDYPVDIPYPFKDQYVLNLTIPDDYEVEEIPQAASLVLPNNGGYFQYLSSQKDSQIQLVIKIQLNQLHFEPVDYSNIKNFFDTIVAKQAEQIVLKKKKVSDK
jgi:Domain of Unknown Function with PDB structure (DUF3857)